MRLHINKASMMAVLFVLSILFAASIPQAQAPSPFTTDAAFGNWTWDSTNKIVTIIANATESAGNTEANAYGFQDIVNAIDLKGWSAQYNRSDSGKQFEWYFRIVIGDGSTTTWFVDTLKQITFAATSVSGASQRLIEVKNNAHLRLGILVDASDKTTSSGVDILSLVTAYNYIRMIRGQGTGSDDVKLYGCHLMAVANLGDASHQIENLSGTPPFYNCIFGNVELISTNADVNRVTISRTQYGLAYATGTFNDMLISDCSFLIYFYSNIATNIINVVGYNGALATFRCYAITTDKTITNGVFDAWTFSWGGTSTAEVYRKYTFDLETTANATTTLYDKDSNIVFTVTDSDGILTQQTVSRGFYNQTGGNTIYDYSPHRLVINATGYQTYNQTFTLDEKIDWRIKLEATATAEATNMLPVGFLLGALIILPIGLLIAKKR